ncbi:LysR family transcriptional regulator [Pseudorhodoferax sp. Leaf267]|uniref:LysR family transcriptional regulator n=1 Tax=Pseudorhodoferax sp. Leaf267 TaxID=1736316 RepID=UPI0006F455E8|nr:LysR family transcriptional regulator [Pseudorhodoferax sp. Leaf267]KQP19389.1 LysR family transcriptional regulator [Pseudorhodoferax sp. Leaf267]
MPRDDLSDLLAFIAITREGSFTRAASKLGLSQSALSHRIRAIETRMGVRLLNRTTRSLGPTEAGERLLAAVTPRFEAIESELQALGALRDEPAGTVRITAVDSAVDTYVWPRLAPLLQRYPDLRVEIDTGYRMVDIVAEKYDFGVRVGEAIAKDMVAVRISPDFRRLIVGAPSYFAQHGEPRTPQDLLKHNCIALRLQKGGIYAWPLQNGTQEQTVRVEGQFTFNGSYQVLHAALSGSGLALSPEYLAGPHVAAGRLRAVMQDWQPVSAGFHLYYPSRRHMPRVMRIVIDALRHDGAAAPTGSAAPADGVDHQVQGA